MIAPHSPRPSRRVACALFTAQALVLAGPLSLAQQARAQDDFSFDIVEEKVADTDKQKIDDARDLLAQERFAEAFAGFESVLNDAKLKKFHEPVQYDLCKGYYKMGAYHASLKCFETILSAGPKHSMYKQSREWLFFIARKVKDELAALELIARYAKAEDIPAEYQQELSYSLGRYYFLKALELGAKGVAVEEKDDTPVEDTSKPDDSPVGLPGDENDTKKPDDKKPDDKKPDDKKPEDEGGFNFGEDALGGGDIDPPRPLVGAVPAPPLRLARADDDGFDFGEAEVKKDKKKAAPAKKPDKKKLLKDAKEKAKEQKEEKAEESSAVVKDEKKEEKREEKAPPKHAFAGPKTADESLKLALTNLKRVDKQDFPYYAQAKYIQGLSQFALGEFDPAVKSFQEVVRLTNPRGGPQPNPKLREMAFFSLARIHYQFEQFRYAIFYYDRIDRDSEQWLESLFESSWAHFRLGEYEKALGNLVTLQSPFFQDEYYPESSILKAITFYENCRYPEARAFLGEFKQSYGGVLAELDRLIGDVPAGGTAEAATGGDKGDGPAQAKSAEQLFTELTDLEKKVAEGRDDANRSFALTARLLRLALSDKRVKAYREAIDEVDEEKQKLSALQAPFSGGPLHTDALKAVDDRRSELVNLAGGLLRDKLENERTSLKDLTAKLLRIQFEITKQEKISGEDSLTGQSSAVVTLPYKYYRATDDERLYWPFEGEYWRDELGTYQYTLTRGCKPPAEATVTGD